MCIIQDNHHLTQPPTDPLKDLSIRVKAIRGGHTRTCSKSYFLFQKTSITGNASLNKLCVLTTCGFSSLIPSEPQMSFLINGWRSVFGASSGATLSRKGVNGSGGLSFFVSFHRCLFSLGSTGGREDNKKERTPPDSCFLPSWPAC